MKTITVGQPGQIIDVLHMALDIEPDGVLIDFGSIIEDIIISSPDGDLLMSWAMKPGVSFNKQECLLLKVQDNLKEFADVNCTQLALCPVGGNPLHVYVTVQNN